MKFLKRHLTLLLILSFCIALASCGFVSYILYPTDENVAEPDFDTTLEQMLEDIDVLGTKDLCHERGIAEHKTALLDAKNELSECRTVAELHEVYEKHVELIISTILKSHVILSDYRADEQDCINDMISEFALLLREVETDEDALSVIRDFEVEIYALKTDAQYYSEELALLKKELLSELSALPIYSDYTATEIARIESIIADFEGELGTADSKELVKALFDSFKLELLSVPTIKDLELIAKNEALSVWESRFNALASKHSLAAQSEISNALNKMKAEESARAINVIGSELMIELSARVGDTEYFFIGAELYLNNVVIPGDYRNEQKEIISSSITSALSNIRASGSTAEATGIFLDTKSLILALPTSDELWKLEDEQFFEDLALLYGDKILSVPEKMYEASSYEELAKIIDYYAFYQTGYDSFLRDTFRVKLLYTYKTAQWEINEVYWYCELIRSAVGITGYIESTSSGNYFVIQLIPYALSTNTNASQGPVEVDRYDSLIEYKPSTDAQLSERAEDFDDFAYLEQNTESLGGIWNTQQLWYALQYGYLPEVVEGSPADLTLKRAKEILRDIILEGMTDEEKIFAIFTYFSENVIFDDDYNKYLYPEDRDHFPDELAATLASFHIEGALFDNLAVCEGFAKAMLLMLRIEGIESYRIFVHGYSANAINNLGYDGYGSHALVAIKMSDGKFYLSDPYEAYQHNTRYQKLHQFLIPWDLHTTYVGSWSMIFTDFVYGDTMLDSVMDGIVYNDKSVFIKTEQELFELLYDFRAEEGSDISISIFVWADRMTETVSVESRLTQFGISYHKVTYKGLTEYIVYK